jgi:hypothetical protein
MDGVGLSAASLRPNVLTCKSTEAEGGGLEPQVLSDDGFQDEPPSVEMLLISAVTPADLRH